MSGKSILRWGLLLAVLALVMSLLVEVRETASASALSVGSRGFFTARRYLEERGIEVTLLDLPLDEAAPAEVLVLAFPWQRGAGRSEQAGIQQHLLRGGTIVLGYSGDAGLLPEREAMGWLGLSPNELRDDPPLGFFAWRAHANQEWSLTPAEGLDAPPLRVSAFSRAPQAPLESEVLYEGPKGEPLVFVFPSLNGRVVVLPSESLGNARLLEAGNADLLESLLSSLGRAWSFDEYHHGLSVAISGEQTRPRFAFDLFLLQLGILYVLVVWRLARSFGPVWPETAVVSGSTRTFLLGLGSLHDRLGHHGDAAELMVQRARELHPRMTLEEAGTVRTGAEFLELAARVARGQAE